MPQIQHCWRFICNLFVCARALFLLFFWFDKSQLSSESTNISLTLKCTREYARDFYDLKHFSCDFQADFLNYVSYSCKLNSEINSKEWTAKKERNQKIRKTRTDMNIVVLSLVLSINQETKKINKWCKTFCLTYTSTWCTSDVYYYRNSEEINLWLMLIERE